VKNVSGGGQPVKGPPDPVASRSSAPGGELPDIAQMGVGRAALEISKLLVEVLQVGHVGRRGGPDAGTPADGGPGFEASAPASGVPGGHGGPLSSHVIRAAIHIYGNGPQTIGQLAAGLGVSQGWASRVVDEMERAGYVARERDPGDRRVVRVSLVPAAVERVEKAYRWRGDAVEAALEGMSPEERAAVAAFLRRFVDEVRASEA
jgi:DNA-binding MarR family transcriptional regulator